MAKLNWKNRCQRCKKLSESTQHRKVKTEVYIGPCGDSFCIGSCTMETCVPINVTICDNCVKELEVK